MSLAVVILAAGQGKRMRSALPKVLHRLGGLPLLEHVVATAQGLAPLSMHVVYGHGGAQVPESLTHLPVQWIEQAEQLGTGHAVLQVLPAIPPDASVLVLYGDVPLIDLETLQRLRAELPSEGIALVTAEIDPPTGYGRIVRSPDGRVMRVVEERDANPQERAIREINTGILLAPAASLSRWLACVDNQNAQGEYYLTDVVALAVAEGAAIRTVQPRSAFEIAGVNDRVQLAELERIYQRGRAQELMLAGVTLADPSRCDVRGVVTSDEDVSIDVNVVLEGRVRLGRRVRIGPNTLIRDSDIGDDVEILGYCVIEGARIGPGSRVGPFTRVRPQTEVAEGVHLGNFVEVKKSTIGAGSKVNHLSYIGDTTVGSRVNVGAGTITCNYDGANKHPTRIEDDAFIGSNTQLVAPVTVGAGATIGAGSTITRDAPAGKLTLSRCRQETVEGWKRPQKKPPQ